MPVEPLVDPATRRERVRDKYREVAVDPRHTFHFHTGRPLAARLGYDQATVDALPDRTVESFAGVGNPFSMRHLKVGERVVDVGSGAGFDSFIAAGEVGETGRVVGVDMTAEMLAKSRATAVALGLDHVEFRHGLAEDLPVEDRWGDVVISNGVINLCADKHAVFTEINRVQKRGGWLQFADIANGRAVPLARRATSTCGPAELRAGCPVRAGGRCSRTSGSSTFEWDRPPTPSTVQPEKQTRDRTTCTATPSWPANRAEPTTGET